jgi:DNA-binding transcriptional ArsR family regulator
VSTKKQANAKKTASKRSRETSSSSVDPRVVKALSHPLRLEILAILNDRMASPNELSRELEEGLSQVSYHVKVLRDFDMIEMVKTEPRRGAVEHYYRASEEVFISSEQLQLMPKSAQKGVWAPVLADIEQDVSTSLKAGTFDRRPDFVVARDTRILDGKARLEAEQLSAEFYERFKELEVDTDRRRQAGEDDGEVVTTTAALLVFDSFLGKNLKPSKKQKKRH